LGVEEVRMKWLKYWFISIFFLLSTSVYASSVDAVQKQILAEASCVALSPNAGHVFAVARSCDKFSASCEQVCSGLSDGKSGSLQCFNSLHIYDNGPFSGVNQLGLKVYKYNSCGGGCGPNYCCCSS